MGNRINIYRKLAEIDSALEDILKNLSMLDKKEDNETLNKKDKINLRFFESRRETLINELHQLEIELVEKTWSEKANIFEKINKISNKNSKYG